MKNLIFPRKQVGAFGGKGVAQGPTEVIMRVGKQGWDVVETPMKNSSKVLVTFLSQLTGQPNSLLVMLLQKMHHLSQTY